MIFVLDNYDSFTYNLVQRLGEIDASLDIQVARNDQITLEEIAALPSAAQSVLADWVATAQTRLDALAAIDTLAQAQTSN